MHARAWAAFGALALALVLLVPAIAPLPESMDAFAGDLSNGTFRPFGDAFGRKASKSFSASLGGLTGQSEGNFLPGADDIPQTWLMDRDGRPGSVVIDYVFNPDPGAMKRLKAYDRVGADGTTLEVADKRLFPVTVDPLLQYDRFVEGSFSVRLRSGEAVPIYSVHPKGILTGTYRTEPAVAGGLQFFKDGADTFHVRANEDKTVTLNLTFLVAGDYYRFEPPPGMRAEQYPPAVRPTLPPGLAEQARVVWARAGIQDPRDLPRALESLNGYFRSFTEGELPPPGEVESLYQALALGGKGCCRHRAFAYMITAQALGVPTRVVVNEAHAFVEVMFTDGRWHQVNLGGCGTYTVNNPRNLPRLFEGADDPRREANPDEGRPVPILATTTEITDSPARIVKGERYHVNGTVVGPDGRGVPGARVDVFLNETKEAPGRLTGAGVTGPDGRFSVEALVPGDAPARSYQLVARGGDTPAGRVRYGESWSDPPVDVFTPTRLLLPRMTAAVGFPANVTGRLVDVDGNPVPDARIRWTAEGRAQPDLVTDAQGAFSGRVAFDTVGNKTLDVRYEGDDHHGPAAAQARLTVERGALLLPAEAPILLRGQEGLLRGEVALAGAGVAGREVRVTLATPQDAAGRTRALATAAATSDDEGAFEALLRVPPALAPGVYPVQYQVASLGLEGTGLARVLAEARLDVDVPATVPQGERATIVATLRGDNGTALAGAIVELTLDGNASTTRALLTNRTGVARFELPAGALPEGAHEARLSFPGTGEHAPAQAARTLRVAPPFWAAVPAWAWLALGLAAALAAGLAWGLRPEGPLRRLLPAGGSGKGRRVVLAWPDHPEGLAPVVEPGGRLRVGVHVEDAEGRRLGTRVLLQAPGRRRWKGRAGAVFDVPAPPEPGILPLHARARGAARLWTRHAAARVAVLPYRQAVETGFVALRERARLAPSASPGDLVRALEPRLDAPARARLREAAALFEKADYSEADVDQAYYHAFARARAEVERRLQDERPPPEERPRAA